MANTRWLWLLAIVLLSMCAEGASAQLIGIRASVPPPAPPIVMPTAPFKPSAHFSSMHHRPSGFNTFGGFFPSYPYYSSIGPSFEIYNNYYYFPEPVEPARSLVPLPPLPNEHPTTARLTLSVPNGAEVWLQGKKVDILANRTFESPDLNPNEPFTFDVRVTWMENGKPVEQKRVLVMRAGEHQSLQYFALPAAPQRVGR